MTLLLQASVRKGGIVILSGMLTYPRGQCPFGAFSWASSGSCVVGGLRVVRQRGRER